MRYSGLVARTNIDIDDELLARVMERYGLRTKKEAVDSALRKMDVKPATREEILAMQGMGWDGDLEAMRANRPAFDAWVKYNDELDDDAGR